MLYQVFAGHSAQTNAHTQGYRRPTCKAPWSHVLSKVHDAQGVTQASRVGRACESEQQYVVILVRKRGTHAQLDRGNMWKAETVQTPILPVLASFAMGVDFLNSENKLDWRLHIPGQTKEEDGP